MQEAAPRAAAGVELSGERPGAEEADDRAEGGVAHPPEGEQEDSLESEETLSPDERGEE